MFNAGGASTIFTKNKVFWVVLLRIHFLFLPDRTIHIMDFLT